jgi:16S rRNA (uracil1498-N3)-methyltransferase
MSAPVFLLDSIAPTATQLELAGSEGRHAATVKRLRVGERLDIVDGKGTRAKCEVACLAKDSLIANVLEIEFTQTKTPQVIAIQALAKGDRADQALEGLTEAGVDEIIPWAASNCVVKWDAASSGVEKWQRTVDESAKQARRSHVPTVQNCVTTKELLALISRFDCMFVLHESAAVELATVSIPQSGSVAIVVGPEGGISPSELEALEDAGARIVLLGDCVMRTATAGLAALAIISSRTPRWNRAARGE